MPRFEWRKTCDDPQRYELIDITVNESIATIIQAGRLWSWHRKTSIVTHGVSPARGAADSLQEAKTDVMSGIPDDTSS
jgi:hypothetical protein